MHLLSKSTYIKGLQCEKALYMTKKHPYLRDRLSIEQRAKFQRGSDVGVLAHQCFPGGIDMSPSHPSQFPKKVKETMENLGNPDVNVMYEAVFQYNDTLIMVDLMVRAGQQWKAIEVKSSLRLSPTFYNDAALQYYVLKGCQVPLADFMLMHLNPDYVRQGDIDVDKLFVCVSVLDFAEARQEWVAQNVERLKQVVALPHAPLVRIGTHCHDPYTCDFIGHCWKNIPSNSYLYTTAQPDDQLFEHYFGGAGTNAEFLKKLPPDCEEARQVEALETHSYYIDYKTLYTFTPHPKPKKVAYLNILLDRPAVPELDGTRPYQEMMLAFALTGPLEPGGHYVWDCFDDHSRWQEGLGLLAEKLTHYELTVSFSPMNTGYKTLNLYEVLGQAAFYHPGIKTGFSLQHVAEAVFPNFKLFEHSRIVVEALSNELTSYEQARNDLLIENEAIEKLYQHFFK